MIATKKLLNKRDQLVFKKSDEIWKLTAQSPAVVTSDDWGLCRLSLDQRLTTKIGKRLYQRNERIVWNPNSFWKTVKNIFLKKN